MEAEDLGDSRVSVASIRRGLRHRRLDPRWKSVLGVPSHCDDAGRACNADRRRDLHLVSLRLNRLTIDPFHGWTLSIGPLL